MIEKIEETKDLGITMTSELDFGKHITKFALKMLGFLKRESVNLHNPSTVMLLYKALIRSHLEYASVIWNPQSKIKISRLERVQRKFI